MKKFLFVDGNGDMTEATVDGILDQRTCLSTVAVGHLVMESTNIPNGVDRVVDNVNVVSVIGVVLEKKSTTEAIVLLKGTVSGLAGFTKAQKVFLGTDGAMTSVKPSAGNLHVIAQCTDASVLMFNPVNTKVKLYTAPVVESWIDVTERDTYMNGTGGSGSPAPGTWDNVKYIAEQTFESILRLYPTPGYPQMVTGEKIRFTLNNASGDVNIIISSTLSGVQPSEILTETTGNDVIAEITLGVFDGGVDFMQFQNDSGALLEITKIEYQGAWLPS